MPQIEVTFDIDANGILNVSAKDLGSGKEQKISITGSSGLTKEEVEKMRQEAESNAEADAKAKEAIETRNAADTMAYQFEKQLKELGDKIPADKKQSIEEAIADVRKQLEGNDTDAIKHASDELQNRFQAVSEELYKQAAAQAGAAGAGAGGPEAGSAHPGGAAGGAQHGAAPGGAGHGDVVDAEFEVVDEDKKGK